MPRDDDDVDDRFDDRPRRRRGQTDSGTKTVLIVLAVVGGLILVGVIGCVGLVGWGMFKAQKVVQEFAQQAAGQAAADSFLELLQADRGGAAYDTTSANFKATMTRDQFTQYVAKNPILTKHKSRMESTTTPVGGPPVKKLTVLFLLSADVPDDDDDPDPDDVPKKKKPNGQAAKGAGAKPADLPKDANYLVTVVDENGAWKVDAITVQKD